MKPRRIAGAGTKGKKMMPATCTKCGRPGKSAQPVYYRCGVCYYNALAIYDFGKADELEAKAKELRARAEQEKARADALLEKWGPPPGVDHGNERNTT